MTSALHKHVFLLIITHHLIFLKKTKHILATSTSITSPEVFGSHLGPRSPTILALVARWQLLMKALQLNLRGQHSDLGHWRRKSCDMLIGRSNGDDYPRGKVNIWIWINSPQKKKTNIRKNPCEFNISLLYTWICIDLNDAKITGKADLTIPACPRSQKSLWPTVIIQPVARPKSPKIRIKNQQQTFEKPLNEHNAHIIHLLKKMAASVCPNFDVRFFPPNQFSNSWHHKTHLGIFLMGFFSDKNSPSDLIPPATDSFTNFVGGIGTREFLTFSSMAGPNSPPRCCRSAWLDVYMGGWLVGQISHCFAVYFGLWSI